MRPPMPLPLLLALAGCASPADPSWAVGTANLASVAVFGRAVPDLVWSGISGRDCSVVRLEQGKTYCKPAQPPPLAQSFCTRSLGVVDCWVNPESLTGPPAHGVADGPQTLTPAQEADRTARWPRL